MNIKELTNLVGGQDECPLIIPYMEGPMSARMRSRDLTFQLNAALSSAQHLIEKCRAVDGRTVERWTVERWTVEGKTLLQGR